jgi:hypothetical protein
LKRIILTLTALFALGLVALPSSAAVTTERVFEDTSSFENDAVGWMFGRDLSTSTPFDFVLGTPSIGNGSLYVPPITAPNSNKFIGELFLQTPMATFDSYAIDYQVETGSYIHFYLTIYATFGSSSPTKFYDCRYNVIATSGGPGAFSTLTFDPDIAPAVVTTRTGGDPSPHACPATPRAMDTLSAGSSVRMIAINVGDTSGSDIGVSAYLDNAVVTYAGDTTIYDFETTPPEFTVVASIGGGNTYNPFLPQYLPGYSGWSTKNVTVYLGCIPGDSPIDRFFADKAVTFKDGVHYYSTKPSDDCIDEDGAEADPIVDWGPIMVDTKAPTCSVSPSTIFINRNSAGTASFGFSAFDATSGVAVISTSYQTSGGAAITGTSGANGEIIDVLMGSSTAGRIEVTWTVTDNAGLIGTCKATVRAR